MRATRLGKRDGRGGAAGTDRFGRGRLVARGSAFALLALLVAGLGVTRLLPEEPPRLPLAVGNTGWVDVDYGPLVNRRELTHSGDSVGGLLVRLDEQTVETEQEPPL